MRKLTKLFIGLTVLVLTIPVQAVLIDFDSGYSAGELWGQPGSGTVWEELSSPNRSGLVVTADAGDLGAGDMAAVSVQDSNPFISNGFYRFATTDANLGGVFNKDASKVNFSFKRKVMTDIGNNGTPVSMMFIGNDYFTKASVVFGWFSDGRMKYFNGPGSNIYSNASYVLDGSGNDFDPSVSDGFIAISGQINFASKTYSLVVNGVAQNGGNPIAFNDPSAEKTWLLISNENGEDSNYRQYALDDITLAIPEPTTMGLLTLGTLGVLKRKK